MPKTLDVTQEVGTLIFNVRSQKVILDTDLARLYGVPTKRLNEQVKRNAKRFPEEFMFQLSQEEAEALLLSRSQNATLKRGQNIKYLPRVFTEHGALMAANVLNSPQAVTMSVTIVKAFVKLRRMVLSIEELSHKVAALERGFSKHGEQFDVVFDAIRQLLAPPDPPRKRIGFHADGE
jgi:hypothetical protein